jgi:hypothetical protein
MILEQLCFFKYLWIFDHLVGFFSKRAIIKLIYLSFRQQIDLIRPSIERCRRYLEVVQDFTSFYCLI